MKSKLTLTLQIFSGLVLCAFLVAAGFKFVQNYGSADAVKEQVVFKGYVTSATIFKSRYTDYKGLCSDVGLPSDVMCADNEDAYRFWKLRTDGTYYCADQTGFSGELTQLNTKKIVCN